MIFAIYRAVIHVLFRDTRLAWLFRIERCV